MIARAWKALVVLVLWRLGGLRRGAGEHEEDPSRRSIEAPPWAEALVLGLLSAVPVAADASGVGSFRVCAFSTFAA